MAKKNSIVNDLILAPWWVSITLAGIIYFLGGILSGVTSSSLGFTVVLSAAKGIAPIFSIALLFIAMLSFIRGFKVRSQLKRQKSVDTLNELSWKSFENVTGELFRQRGYRVEETLGGGADGGVDLRLRKDKQLTLVQCKQWKKKKVGLPIIRELLGAMTAESAQKGILVTTSTFTSEAITFAQKQGIQLINGTQLSQAIDNLHNNNSTLTTQNSTSPPPCPRCNQPMKLRTAKRGPNTGSQFWGCAAYPKCRGTINL